jgi:hypothetical protein
LHINNETFCAVILGSEVGSLFLIVLLKDIGSQFLNVLLYVPNIKNSFECFAPGFKRYSFNFRIWNLTGSLAQTSCRSIQARSPSVILDSVFFMAKSPPTRFFSL